MDHVYESIKVFYEIYLDQFVAEWETKQYKRHTDCPSYPDLKAIVDAMNILRVHMYWDRLNLRDELRWKLDNL